MRAQRRLAFAVVALAVSSGVFAGQVSVDTLGSTSDPFNGWEGSGGAFRITPISGDNGQNGGFGTPPPGTFLTFCIERNESVSDGGTYYTKIATSADNGGLGGPDPDPLSSAAAKIYATFRAATTFSGLVASFGGLTGWSDTVTNNRKVTSAVQYAIWRHEEETDSSYTGLSQSTKVKTWADAIYTWGNTNDGSLYNVRVLQLWDNANFTGARQDQLTLVPTPQASLAGASLLGGLGVVSYLKRRRDKNRDGA